MLYDVIVYGPLFCDLIFTQLDEMPTLGKEIFAGNFTINVGGSAIVAAGLQKLGVKVGLVADLGNDALSRVVGEVLEEMAIDRTLIRTHPHPLTQLTVALSFPQDRAFITRFEKPTQPADLAEILTSHPTRHVHIGSFLGAFDALDAGRIAHEAGATISLDPGWDESALRDVRLHAMLPDLDYFMPSRSELTFMMQEEDTHKAMQQAHQQMQSGKIIMKDGAQGALGWGDGWQYHASSLVVEPIDTTGAGDAFDAGFVYGLVNELSLEECMRYGVVCGALTTTSVGGATGTPTLEEVKIWLPKLQS
jgi:sugar/nucleoside kinase (ribokinase family)